MATTRHHLSRRARRGLLVLLTAAAAGTCVAVGPALLRERSTIGTEGTVTRVKPTRRPTVEAAFVRESYAPGQRAKLRLFDAIPGGTIQVFRAGTENTGIGPRDLMLGTPMTKARGLAPLRPGRVLSFKLGAWSSGLYFVRLTAPGNRVGFAPFVLRPHTLGGHRVAIVLPTYTWQAYNFRDDDGDGDGDTWYAGADERFARLARPYENRGVPPHYKHYDQPFLRWLHETARNADYLAQSDLDGTTGERLARAYRLIIFPGHHEYVTGREYDAVQRYRDLGGNLAFLSANNFFWRVDRRGDAIWRIRKWRELGRPEAALIGVQYIGNDYGEHRGAWIVRRAGASSWVFAGTRVSRGSEFSNGGIEIDKTAPSSPRGTAVLAEIPDLLGPGMTGQMTYYETARGAKVFAAGAFSLAGSVRQPPVRRLLSNLWNRLGSDRE